MGWERGQTKRTQAGNTGRERDWTRGTGSNGGELGRTRGNADREQDRMEGMRAGNGVRWEERGPGTGSDEGNTNQE